MVVSHNVAQNPKNFLLKIASLGLKLAEKSKNNALSRHKKFISSRFEQFLIPNTMLFDKLHTKSKVSATKCSFHGIYASLRGRFF
jgi:hypothetical protein